MDNERIDQIIDKHHARGQFAHSGIAGDSERDIIGFPRKHWSGSPKDCRFL